MRVTCAGPPKRQRVSPLRGTGSRRGEQESGGILIKGLFDGMNFEGGGCKIPRETTETDEHRQRTKKDDDTAATLHPPRKPQPSETSHTFQNAGSESNSTPIPIENERCPLEFDRYGVGRSLRSCARRV